MKILKEAVRAKLIGEMKELAIVTGYLFIVFAVLLYFKSAILKSQGIHWIPWSFAAVKAVIVAKFILIGRAIHFAESYHAKPLIWETAYKSLAFVVLVSALTVMRRLERQLARHWLPSEVKHWNRSSPPPWYCF